LGLSDVTGDLDAFLKQHGADGYPVDEIRHCGCDRCGATVFEVHGVIGEQLVRRVCRTCGDRRFIADSGEYWDERQHYVAVCTCDSESFTVAVGYSLYAPDVPGIRSVATAERCVACGQVASLAEWMLRTGDMSLLECS
jgi:ribosomal protein S27AE